MRAQLAYDTILSTLPASLFAKTGEKTMLGKVRQKNGI